MKTADTPSLRIAYEEGGPPDGQPALLLHGWPYDVRAFDAVVPALAQAGCRVITPYLRGFGPTQFRSDATQRSGQQAALAADVAALMDALALPSAVLAGYDWGGRAVCAAAALWPDRVRGLVSVGGYLIQDIASAAAPLDPEQEHRYWYQYYLHAERGRAGLAGNRRAFCRLLWRLWSPDWAFDEATFERTAASFDSPDFVDVTCIPIGTASAMPRVTRRSTGSSSGWRSGRRSPCQRWCCTAAMTASGQPGSPRVRPTVSPVPTGGR